MPRFCFVVVLVTACTPALDKVAVRAPAADVEHQRVTAPATEAPHRRRVARLAPPFAANPSTRRVDDSAPPELELAVAR